MMAFLGPSVDFGMMSMDKFGRLSSNESTPQMHKGEMKG